MRKQFVVSLCLVVLVSLSFLAVVCCAADAATYVGPKKCKMCHMKMYKPWEGTKHATAMKALGDSAVAKAECLACHTTAYKKTGGYESVEKTPEMAFVGCEVCHGPGSAHIKASSEERKKTISKPDAKVCVTCHTAKWSPKFKFETYKLKVHPAAG